MGAGAAVARGAAVVAVAAGAAGAAVAAGAAGAVVAAGTAGASSPQATLNNVMPINRAKETMSPGPECADYLRHFSPHVLLFSEIPL